MNWLVLLFRYKQDNSTLSDFSWVWHPAALHGAKPNICECCQLVLSWMFKLPALLNRKGTSSNGLSFIWLLLYSRMQLFTCTRPPFYAMKMLRYLFGWADTPKNDILINHVLRQLNRSEVGSAAELSVFRSFLDTCHLSLVAYESWNPF